ncbi:DNA translocase FtsK 4TM domain-containing protein [Candidatus Falkowbacteria bacterium]|nr:DNA translocase FtsK 4TM domain-containing protein [Candidatus Falkowbacteria bacterium]
MARGRRKIRRIKSLRDLDFGEAAYGMSDETKRVIIIVILLTAGVLTLLSLIDLAGTLGVYLNGLMKFLFGVNRFYLPLIFFVVGYFLIRPLKYGFKTSNTIGLVLFLLGFSGFLNVIFHQDDLLGAAGQGLSGGYLGVVLAWPLIKLMGFWASVVVTLAISVIGFLLLFETYIVSILEKRNSEEENEEGQPVKANIFSRLGEYFSQKRVERAQVTREQGEEEEGEEPEFSQYDIPVEQEGTSDLDYEQGEDISEEDEEAKQLNLGVTKFKQTKVDLPLELLDGKTTTPKGGDLKANKMIIEKTLANFGIRAEMGDAQVGPTVTQYTLKPAEGVKLSRITGLGDNLALALAAHPIRVEAPIPGKSLVGIEVPNQAAAIVPLKEILASNEFKSRQSNLAVAIGKDVMGRPWLYPLDRMPHLLIAGSTGSGKSVCINALILSLLYQNGPGELKFIMVDPKRVELPIYNGIPHLLTPVITDVKKTINALRWAIKEMENRFDLLSKFHNRNIASYNAENDEKIPYIVIVIDELADLMAAAGPEVEAAVVRLSQMARAVGIHLVLATQRPSVDVLTGLIKANITSRIAFSVASLVDSRTILDMSGAEKLLGRGDMLYISAEISRPKRLQGAFASDAEIKRVATHLKKQAGPEYITEVVEKQQIKFDDFASKGFNDDEGDMLLEEAREVIVKAKKASASLLQRRLRIGYARAARILDLLEARGVIGPGDGAKPREVLINSLGGAKIYSADKIFDKHLKDESDDYEDENEEDYLGEEEAYNKQEGEGEYLEEDGGEEEQDGEYLEEEGGEDGKK